MVGIGFGSVGVRFSPVGSDIIRCGSVLSCLVGIGGARRLAARPPSDRPSAGRGGTTGFEGEGERDRGSSFQHRCLGAEDPTGGREWKVRNCLFSFSSFLLVPDRLRSPKEVVSMDSGDDHVEMSPGRAPPSSGSFIFMLVLFLVESLIFFPSSFRLGQNPVLVHAGLLPCWCLPGRGRSSV